MLTTAHPCTHRRSLLAVLILLALTLTTLLSQPGQTHSAAAPPLTAIATTAPSGWAPSPAAHLAFRAHAAGDTRYHPAPRSRTISTAPPPVRPTATSPAGPSSAALTSEQAVRLARTTVPGLVNITTEFPGGGGEAGTGIVLRSTGLVLTAGHVVAGAVTLRAVDLGDGNTYPATLIGLDRRHDIALIQLTGATDLPTARIATTGIRPHEMVESIGNAYGRGYPSIGIGPVTALHQTIANPASPGHRISGLIAADNSIVPGQSGGPMINRRGEVVGVNDAYQLTGGTPTGIGYAVPIATAVHVAHALLAHHNQLSQPDTLT